MVKQKKIASQKDQHIYNNCYELLSRAINQYYLKSMCKQILTNNWNFDV